MKVSEVALWTWLSQARKSGHHVERVENTLSRSMPDVEASVGTGGFWIELKTAEKPKRDSTPVRFRFQPGQARWLQKRWDIDQGAWLLCQVDRERYLIPGGLAMGVEAGLTVTHLRTISHIGIGANAERVLETASNSLGG